MKTADIAAAKNQLSRLLKRVERGETILITDRNHPVARREPVSETDATLRRLQALGVLTPPTRGPLDVRAVLQAPRARLRPHDALSAAVLSEREESA